MMGVEKFCVSTAWQMMQYLGYNYSEIKKGHYTDGHERDDVVKDRNERFLKKYFSYELQTMRWIQVTEEDAIKLETTEKDFPKNCYYQFDNNGIRFREYHIDSHNVLKNFIWPENEGYGGDKSVRARRTTQQQQTMPKSDLTAGSQQAHGTQKQ